MENPQNNSSKQNAGNNESQARNGNTNETKNEASDRSGKPGGVKNEGADKDVKNAASDKAALSASNARQEVSEHKEQLAYDFREMVSSAEALLKSTANYTGAEIDEARTRLEQQLSAARDRSREMGQTVCEFKQDLAHRADECVHRHPWTCIGAAFLVGMGVAHCLRR